MSPTDSVPFSPIGHRPARRIGLRAASLTLLAVVGALAFAGCALGASAHAGPGPAAPEGSSPPIIDEGVILTAPAPVQACPAARFQGLIGQSEEAARAALAGVASPVRVICWNCQVTKDFRPDRLNVLIDQRGMVDSLSCG